MRLKLLIFLVVTVTATAYTLVEYARVLPGGRLVAVDLAETGGLFENAEVTYRGVPAGRVESLRLTADGVRARLRLEIPVPAAGTLAVVANRSGVGEQYLDLRPASTAGPYLADGDVIPRERTRLPVSTARLLESADGLLRSVDPRDVETVVTELQQALDGPHLRRLLEAGSTLVDSAAGVLPETVSLVRHGETVLRTQRELGGELKAFARDLSAFTDDLEARHLDGAIDASVAVVPPVEKLVDGVSPHLRPLLTNLVIGGQTASARAHALRQLMIGYPAGIAGAFTVVQEDGLHFGLNLNLNVPPPCREGYLVERRYPQDTSVRAARLDTHCKAPRPSETAVRGSRNVPDPLPTPGIPGLRAWLAGYDPVTWRDGS
ncbi:MlaD family protein [Nonomuraea soli]|uniref:Phospholipid/cholesterol/gamma-HCH transport system substrate-binding protein n=1 Tax=Nonomuraea soli TaxID=1032476 RepID=A0A7W0HVK7_9ACTN|nr:MlaD family protein [Nonomuraea soli]MBA2897142.1 phospholipid/cholesterol/gamma-HCH transport system substrate-binding protein [Nonomuraea soli]